MIQYELTYGVEVDKLVTNKMVCVAANKNKDWFYNHTHSGRNYYVSRTTGTTKWYYPNPYYDKTNMQKYEHSI